MNLPPEMVPFLTAEETIICAIQTAGNFDPASQPDKNQPDFEYRTLQACFARIAEISTSPEALASKIASCLRKYRHTNTLQIAAPSAEIAQILIEHTNPDDNLRTILPLASIQITASVLSLIKKNPAFERLISACETLPYPTQTLHQLKTWITALLPCNTAPLRSERYQRISKNNQDISLISNDELRSFLLFSDSIPESQKTDITFYPAHRIPSDNTDLEQAARTLIHSVMHSPMPWICTLYSNASAPQRHAIYTIVASKLSNMQRIVPSESDFGSWLQAESSNLHDIESWLLHRSPNTSAADETLKLLLTTLRRRENGDTGWATFWLRNPHTPSRSCENHHLRPLAEYLTIQAFRAIGAFEQANKTIEEYLANGCESPVMWLLLAVCATDVGKFGTATHAIERASEQPPSSAMPLSSEFCAIAPSFWQKCVNSARYQIGRAALSHAMHAQTLESSLLELAISHGDAQTISEAALCWFDADLPDSDIPAKALAQSPKAREYWISSISRRRDISHIDKLYNFFLKLSVLCPESPEMQLLEALCQLDNPPIAAQTLIQAIRRLPENSPLHREVLSLQIELFCQFQAYDEAVNTIVTQLQNDAPDALPILRELIAKMPREALPMLQTMMCEQLGRDKTLQVFDNLRQPSSDTATQPPQSIDIPWPSIELCLLPVAYQIYFCDARIDAAAPDTAKAARRESVFAARGIQTKAFDAPPEPPQWVHTPQQRASDAFKS